MMAAKKELSVADKEAQVIRVLKTIFDPEIPFNIYDLGLIYGVGIDADNLVTVVMTLTTPMCPVAESMPQDVADKVKGHLAWVTKVKVELVWEPPWEPSKMVEEARLFLGF